MDLALRVFRLSEIQEIISASEVDTASLKDLVCKCLCCNDFVDFVAANREGASKNRPAHFKHKNYNKTLSLACEKRVRNMANNLAEQQKKSAILRQKWIKNSFWNLFKNHYDGINFPISEILDALTPFHTQVACQMANQWKWMSTKKSVPEISLKVQEQATRCLNLIFSGKQVIFDAGGKYGNGMHPRQVQDSFRELFIGKLNQKLQTVIVTDVIDFLYQPRSLPIIKALLEIAIYCITDCLQDNGNIGLEPQGYSWVVYQGHTKGVDPRFWDYSDYNRQLIFQYCVDHIILWICLIPYPLLA